MTTDKLIDLPFLSLPRSMVFQKVELDTIKLKVAQNEVRNFEHKIVQFPSYDILENYNLLL
jgi:hypothetical protein